MPLEIVQNDFCLKKVCHSQKSDGFVGIQINKQNSNTKEILSIQFPIGYHLSNDENGLKQDVLTLISVLSHLSDFEPNFINYYFRNDNKVNTCPIDAYIFIIQDYLRYGYYKENYSVYQRKNTGKIDWNKTIKAINPQLSKEGFLYTDFITRNTLVNQNNLITKIHQYCVWLCFSLFGFLFSDYHPRKPDIPYSHSLFVFEVTKKMHETFTGRHFLLFKNMLAVLNNFSEDNYINSELLVGTNHFYHAWEIMVNKVFGISDAKKNYYFPKTSWELYEKYSKGKKNNHPLIPDTIMYDKSPDPSKIFILDAKYYKFGIAFDINELPGSESLTKQIAYGEYAEKVIKKNKEIPIYNAFILPFDCKDEKPIQNFGYGIVNWKEVDKDIESKPYYKIHGIMIDSKLMMETYLGKPILKKGDLENEITNEKGHQDY